MSNIEQWVPIPSFPGYFANAEGQIFGKRGWILSPTFDAHGYLQLTVYRDGKQFSRKLHQLVCEAFHGPKPEGAECVAHNDGVRTNCSAANLRYTTNKKNTADMIRHGTKPQRESHGMAILSESDVAYIRMTYANKQPGRYIKRGTRQQLAAKFGVGVHVIKDIIAGRSWL